ncbi:MAG: 5-formyltetrahydrofolate cyclo-ligase [Flavobacteriales bacterium]
MTKSELRKLYKAKREELSGNDIDEMSRSIATNFFSTFQCNGKNVHVYLPISQKKEVDTTGIINTLKTNNRLIVSRTNFERQEMTHIEWSNTTSFFTSEFGIKEPTGGLIVEPASIDLVLVPLLAYDTEGNRVGYGRGFYDKFLKNCKRRTQFIGLSFFEPENSIDDIEKHDIRLNYCVTSNQVYHFKE